MQNNQNHWRVTFYEEGDDPLVEDMHSFADAWAVSLPYPDEDGLTWQRLERQNVEARFAAGETSIVVCRASAGTFTVIERI